MRFSLTAGLALALASVAAHAQTAPDAAATAAQGSSPFMSLVPLGAIVLVMFFMVIRPQMKQASARQAMLDSIAKGDTVVTGGGVVGKVTKLVDDLAFIEIAPGLEIKALRATVSGVYVKPDAAALAAAADKRATSEKRNASKNDNSAPSKSNVANDN